MRVQIFLEVGQDLISKKETGELLDQRFYMVTTTKEIKHITRNFVQVDGYLLGNEGPLIRSMATWHQHIDHFMRKYDKAFAVNPLFGVDVVKCIHNWVKVFLHP